MNKHKPVMHHNLSIAELVQASVWRKEGSLTETGALLTTTGEFTGRSPKDRFIVKDEQTVNQVAWGKANQPISKQHFDSLYQKALTYMADKELFVFDGQAGADKHSSLSIRVINEYAWHNLFAQQLFIRDTVIEPEFTVICLPGLKADPQLDGTNSETFIVLSFEKKVVLIGGTAYAGEMKKSIFSVLNYLLPLKGILPMHCSANVGKEKGDTALFFGLSGTGKTTLSADESRQLIGDDEHGWSDNGVFNLEGGCYAKCIGLTKDKEPQIWNAIKFGTVLENVDRDANTNELDFTSGRLTENTRAAYPLTHIPDAVLPSKTGHPNVIFFLTADAFGVLPPISKLTKEQAMYHFLSGYTSKLAGTERGVTEPEVTFSTCFGEPFLPQDPSIYATMLGKKLEKHDVEVYLVNTGWTGGPYGVGERIPLHFTRTMISAALNGDLQYGTFRIDPVFGLAVPTYMPGIPDKLLIPEETWEDEIAFERKAKELANHFHDNFRRFSSVSEAVRQAGPIIS
nr:phosphoenolpyruvate carboxykinase (ATP) [Radiobacillus deserti]